MFGLSGVTRKAKVFSKGGATGSFCFADDPLCRFSLQLPHGKLWGGLCGMAYEFVPTVVCDSRLPAGLVFLEYKNKDAPEENLGGIVDRKSKQ